MIARRLGLLVLVAALGVGAGYSVAALVEDDSPQRIDTAAPVLASKPSVPSTPKVKVLEDPDEPPLEANLTTRPEKIGERPFEVRVPVPNGWVRSNPAPGQWRWYPPPGDDRNTYFIRITQIKINFQAVPVALAQRIRALETADSVQEFDLESSTDDTFVASYVSEGYRRITWETFLSTDGDEVAELSIAVIGRERDRDGLAALLPRLKAGVSAV